mgnify:CR=1 FL=1
MRYIRAKKTRPSEEENEQEYGKIDSVESIDINILGGDVLDILV